MYLTVTVAFAVVPVKTPPPVILAVPVPEITDQVPPPTAFVKAGVEAPVQTVAAPPPIAAGVGLTVKALFAIHPFTVYLTVTVPAEVPVTTPPTVTVAVPVPRE